MVDVVFIEQTIGFGIAAVAICAPSLWQAYVEGQEKLKNKPSHRPSVVRVIPQEVFDNIKSGKKAVRPAVAEEHEAPHTPAPGSGIGC